MLKAVSCLVVNIEFFELPTLFDTIAILALRKQKPRDLSQAEMKKEGFAAKAAYSNRDKDQA